MVKSQLPLVYLYTPGCLLLVASAAFPLKHTQTEEQNALVELHWEVLFVHPSQFAGPAVFLWLFSHGIIVFQHLNSISSHLALHVIKALILYARAARFSLEDLEPTLADAPLSFLTNAEKSELGFSSNSSGLPACSTHQCE